MKLTAKDRRRLDNALCTLADYESAIKQALCSAPGVAPEATIKPCPFCGNAPRYSVTKDESLWSHNIVDWQRIDCHDCDVFMQQCDNAEAVVEAWNGRPQEDAAIARAEKAEAARDASEASAERYAARANKAEHERDEAVARAVAAVAERDTMETRWADARGRVAAAQTAAIRSHAERDEWREKARERARFAVEVTSRLTDDLAAAEAWCARAIEEWRAADEALRLPLVREKPGWVEVKQHRAALTSARAHEADATILAALRPLVAELDRFCRLSTEEPEHDDDVVLGGISARMTAALRGAALTPPASGNDPAVPAAPVPRGHCNRCDRCGWTFAASGEKGCVPGNCSQRPAVPLRSTCAGCGTPYADPGPAPSEETKGGEPKPDAKAVADRIWAATIGRKAGGRQPGGEGTR